MTLNMRLILSAAALLLLGGCVATGLDGLTSGGRPQKGLSQELARGYTMLAEYESSLRGDEIMAGHFRQKASMAASGRPVDPDKVVAATKDLAQARDLLMAAKLKDADQDSDLKIAEAQVNFDCWAERNARRDASSQYCRERFYAAMEGLIPPDIAFQPAPQEMEFSVFFDSGVEVPDDQAFAVIKKAAASFVDEEPWRVHLTGYADDKGGKETNLMLSMRRALAVRNALAQNGVELDKIFIEAEGGQKKSSAGQQARRVDIHIVRADEDKRGDGPDITKIAPQYFGEEAGDF